MIQFTIISNVKDKNEAIKKVITSIKEQVTLSGEDYTRQIQRQLRIKLLQNNNIWKGDLWNSIIQRRQGVNAYLVYMNKVGMFLDRARPHFVKAKNGSSIQRWALDKGSEKIKRIATRQGFIYVKPHPFLDESFEQVNLNEIINKRIQFALENIK